MSFALDIDAFFDVDAGFADDAVYNGTRTIPVIFENDYFAVNVASVRGESSQPQAYCRTVDVPNAAHGDTLTIDSVIYTVVSVQPDGTGTTLLILRK